MPSPDARRVALALLGVWLAAVAVGCGATAGTGAPDGTDAPDVASDAGTNDVSDVGPVGPPEDIGVPDTAPPDRPVSPCDAPAATLECGQSAGPYLAMVPEMSDYACLPGQALLGAEAVYRYTAVEDQLVRFSVDAAPAPYLARLVLVGECAEHACTVGAEPGDADRQLILETQAGETYWFVIDSTVGGLVEVAAVALECSDGEVCADAIDNDWDGGTDCSDADCSGVDPCEAVEQACADGFDNDADDLIDCADPDCAGRDGCEAEESECEDGLDNDADGATDCADPGCVDDVACLADCSDLQAAIVCGDELVGLAASEPAWFGHACAPGAWSSAEIVLSFTPLTSGAARVGIELTDPNAILLLYEGACDAVGTVTCQAKAFLEPQHLQTALEFPFEAGQPYTLVVDAAQTVAGNMLDVSRVSMTCSEVEDCGNGEDDDWDGKTDCADAECLAAGAPCEAAELSCGDGFDNDGDGQIDCGDASCVLAGPPCEASEVTCDDGLDNDGDATIDCGDADCAGSGDCEVFETLCDDDLDNDGDGVSDCADLDCVSAPECDTACPSPILVECGAALSASATGSADTLGANACLGVPAAGWEVVYELTPPADSLVTFSVSGPGAGDWLLALHEGPSCTSAGCSLTATVGGSPATLQTWLTGGQPAWFVVDRPAAGAVAVDAVSVTCD